MGVVAATHAELPAALIRRGPWGYLSADDPIVASTATWVIESLAQRPDLIRPVT